MTVALQDRSGPQQTALFIWKTMSIGPLVFLFWVVAVGLMLLLESYGLAPTWMEPSEDITAVGAMLFTLLMWLPPLSIIACEIAGVRIAYNRRGVLADTPLESHATSAIRTFWIMFCAFAGVVCLCLMMLTIPNIDAVGFGVSIVFILLAAVPLLFIWKAFRVVRGWRRASAGKPVSDHPTRWT